MQLIVQELTSELFQSFMPDSNKQVSAIRPHLYIRNNPVGNVKVQVLTSDDVLITESDPVAFSEITNAIEYHGYVAFFLNASLKKDETYRIKIVSGGGYSFSESAYVAICNDYDLRKYTPEYTIASVWQAPLDIEIWTTSQK